MNKRVAGVVQLFFILLFATSVLSQEEEMMDGIEVLQKDSRFRVQAGIFRHDPDAFYLIGGVPFFNINYRSSPGITEDNIFNLGFSYEVGVNYYQPYVKIGPEIRLFKNFYTDFHGGGVIIYYFGINKCCRIFTFCRVNGRIYFI